ncbi:polysaccharide biosynthesis tyrosine autokinase [Francisellaceae bacterium]|nr:polysaccharide biosynthesis tyrosine autokinase [Francisellaceae bacterium]
MKTTSRNTGHQEDVIDLKEILGEILNHKWLVIGVTCVFFLFGLIHVTYRIPTYSTSTLLNIGDSSNASSNLSALFRQFGGQSWWGDSSTSARQSEIIQSSDVLAPVAKELNLDVSVHPYYFPFIGQKMADKYNRSEENDGPAKPFLGFSSYSWGGDHISIAEFHTSKVWENNPFELIYKGNDTYDLYDAKENLILKGHTGKIESVNLDKFKFLTLNISHITANPGTRFSLRKLDKKYAAENIGGPLKVEETEQRTNLLSLSYTGKNPTQIAMTLNAIAQSAVKNDAERQSANAAKVLNFLRGQIPLIQKKLNTAETKLNNYRSETGNLSLSANTELLMSQLGDYDGRIAKLKLELAQLAEKLTTDNPELKQAQNTLQQLIGQKAELQKSMRALPKSDQIAVSFMREVELQNKVYQSLSQQIQQYEILKAGTIGSLEIINPAPIPYAPIGKPAKLILALSIILGLFLSIAFIFIRNFLFKGIEDPDAIEDKFDLTIFGALHQSKLQRKQMQQQKKKKTNLKLLSEIDPHDLTVEGLRSILTNLYFQLPDMKNNIITISGPVPNVGKSFVTIHLAHMIAESGKKVLVIDADLRKGDLHHYVAPDHRQPGFTDALHDEPLENCIYPTRNQNLSIMPTGKFMPHVAELLVKDVTKEMLSTLSSQYDLIVIDTAPVLAVTDAARIMPHSGLNLLVFASGKHDEREIRLTLKRFETAGVNIDGFIFNLIQHSHSYYGNKYKYKYTYQ